MLWADFQEIYGLDLADLWSGSLHLFRAAVLVEQLKGHPQSRYAAEVRGGGAFYGWDQQTYLLAEVHDRLQFLLPALGGVKVAERFAYPRPQKVTAVKPVGTISDFDTAAFLAGKW